MIIIRFAHNGIEHHTHAEELAHASESNLLLWAVAFSLVLGAGFFAISKYAQKSYAQKSQQHHKNKRSR